MPLTLRAGFVPPPPEHQAGVVKARSRPGRRAAAGLLLAAAVLLASFAEAQTVSITSSPANGTHYVTGETISTRISGLSPISAVSTNQIANCRTRNPDAPDNYSWRCNWMRINIGGVVREARTVRQPTGGRTFINYEYTVVAGDFDSDGIGIPANSIVGKVWRQTSILGPVVNRNHAALGSQSGHRVNLPVPRVAGVALGSPDVGDTFERGEVIEATVTFDKAVTVTGTPQLALGIGSNTRQADYASGTGTRRLVFRYTVVQADSDPNGISIAAAALALNSGTIVETGGTYNAALGLGSHAVTDSADHKVDGSALTAAAVNGASISSRPRGRGSYGAGERIEVRVRFNRAVDVTGTPQLALTIGEETRQADYASGTGTMTLSFSYEVAADDLDEDGVSVAADALTLNGGEIDDARSATAAAGLDLGTNAIRDAAGHRVNFVIEDDDVGGPPGPAPPEPPAGVEAASDGGGSVTISWAHPGDPDVASYEYLLQRAGRTVGDWRTVPGSDADTTSVTIDLTTGEARAVNNAAPPVEWTILLRARDRNGNAGGIARTTVTAAGAPVPAVPAAWLGVQAVLLLWCRRRWAANRHPR